jgi:hypothetical protein
MSSAPYKFYYLYEIRCNPLANKVILRNKNIISSNSFKQSTIYIRLSNTSIIL